MTRLLNGRDSKHAVHLTNRVFALHLQELLHDIQVKEIFGRVTGRVWVIEYQKRGVTILYSFEKKTYKVFLFS